MSVPALLTRMANFRLLCLLCRCSSARKSAAATEPCEKPAARHTPVELGALHASLVQSSIQSHTWQPQQHCTWGVVNIHKPMHYEWAQWEPVGWGHMPRMPSTPCSLLSAARRALEEASQPV